MHALLYTFYGNAKSPPPPPPQAFYSLEDGQPQNMYKTEESAIYTSFVFNMLTKCALHIASELLVYKIIHVCIYG